MFPRSFVRVMPLALVLMTAPLHADRILLVAGGTEEAANVPANRARLHEPFGVAADRSGNLYVIEMAGRLLKVDAAGRLAQLAGTAGPGWAGDGGPAATARFQGPHSLLLASDGGILVADTWNGRVRRIDPANGVITSLPGYAVPAERARANGPYGIALDWSGRELYIADLRRVLALDLATGRTRVVAGNGSKGVPVDGTTAASAPLVDPRAVAVDHEGRVYVLERSGHALRVVTRDGTIRTVVNASGKKGATGDGGDALHATLNGPKHLCIDVDDTVIIADAENHLIRRYVPATGRILRVAGTGKKGTAGIGGAPPDCELNRPHGVAVDRAGSLYIVDSYNDRVLKVVR